MIHKYGPLALISTGIYAAVGTPLAFAAATYATFKVGMSVLKKVKKRLPPAENTEDDPLFI